MKTIDFYSQNFEDVMLERCFSDVEDGFYIDVGAQDEESDSVTKHFYEKGWKGINIEPVSEYCETFKVRDRDITINCAAGSENAKYNISIFHKTGLSSLSQSNINQLEKTGLKYEEKEIDVRTINTLMSEQGIGNKRFEFLKIDVEGFEIEVIKGIDLSQYRPKIILCEVTKPNSMQYAENYLDICDLVEREGYEKVYFDGINQWWCEQEIYKSMSKHFILPPCVFDSLNITPYSGTSTRKKAKSLMQEIKNATSKKDELLKQLQVEKHEKQELLKQLEAEKNEKQKLCNKLDEIYSSRRWKLAGLIGKLNINKREIDS